MVSKAVWVMLIISVVLLAGSFFINLSLSSSSNQLGTGDNQLGDENGGGTGDIQLIIAPSAPANG